MKTESDDELVKIITDTFSDVKHSRDEKKTELMTKAVETTFTLLSRSGLKEVEISDNYSRTVIDHDEVKKPLKKRRRNKRDELKNMRVNELLNFLRENCIQNETGYIESIKYDGKNVSSEICESELKKYKKNTSTFISDLVPT